MYLDDKEVEKNALRQGDIVSNIHLLGAINSNNIVYSAPMGSQKPEFWSVKAEPSMGDAMVLSHSCEIAKENNIKVTSIILAPIRDVSTATAAEKVEQLIASNLIDQTRAEASYLKYFYINPHPLLSYKSGAIVDFSKCFSFRKQSLEYLIGKKILQLRPEIVSSMSLKLALYFYREMRVA